MNPWAWLLVLSAASRAALPFEEGLCVRGEVALEPGTYRVTKPIRIVEHGAHLDLRGVILVGPRGGGPADSFTDTAIVVEGLRGVTIANATLRGFKVGIAARACTSLVITGCDVSGNYRQRLHSTPERENEADWLWPHHNDDGEWASRYGAGILLDRCFKAEVYGNVGHDGQNGIILSRTDSSFVYDNDMSFNSGWGLAMWRSCANEVSNNQFDYCVRGYSHDVYRRGQDSAGILVFEQCCDNAFAFNSATHGGDGFFLYAGHETLERTGLGGSNRNLLFRNDFSHAVANGIEATFSSGNRFIENTLDECEYGIWAGYSYETDIVANRITRCARAGIAIEHGHDNWIEGNSLEGNRVGVLLWAFPNAQFDGSVYGQHQNTRSERYHILRNRFEADTTAIRVHASSDVEIVGNDFSPLGVTLHLKTSIPRLTFRDNNVSGGTLLVKNEGPDTVRVLSSFTAVTAAEGEVVILEPLRGPVSRGTGRLERGASPPSVRGTLDARLPPEWPRGRRSMVIDEWGPVRPGRPHLFPRDPSGWGVVKLFLTGPAMPFEVGLVSGPVTVEPLSGRVPARLEVRPLGQGWISSSLQIEARGQGLETSVSLASSPWRVRFYAWSPEGSDGGLPDVTGVVSQPPLDEQETEAIDFWWGGAPPTERVRATHFLTVGETTISLPAGTYVAHTISDDGVRLFLDGRILIEDWTEHFVKEDRASFTVATGLHRFRVEHCQAEGSSWLQVWISNPPASP